MMCKVKGAFALEILKLPMVSNFVVTCTGCHSPNCLFSYNFLGTLKKKKTMEVAMTMPQNKSLRSKNNRPARVFEILLHFFAILC